MAANSLIKYLNRNLYKNYSKKMRDEMPEWFSKTENYAYKRKCVRSNVLSSNIK